MQRAGIAALEQQWIGRVQVSQPERYFEWGPFPLDRFTALLEACLPYVPIENQTFLDVGCGIGTKLLVAAFYGLAAHGIDRVPEYLNEAARLGTDVEEVLAEDYAGYGRFGLVYLNHPLIVMRPGDNRAALLERSIHAQMTPGSVLLSVNCDCPTDIYDDWTEIVRDGPSNAAWVKS